MAGMKSLSPDFVKRLRRFTVLPLGWDGDAGIPVSSDVAKKARALASESLQYAPEPFVAPTADGAVLLKWDLPNGIEVECFADPEEPVPDVAVTEQGIVRAVSLTKRKAILGLLQELASK
jgi:hypothetical protein